jgi:hypothetical protein
VTTRRVTGKIVCDIAMVGAIPQVVMRIYDWQIRIERFFLNQ